LLDTNTKHKLNTNYLILIKKYVLHINISVKSLVIKGHTVELLEAINKATVNSVNRSEIRTSLKRDVFMCLFR
jgi:hypothetical protein